MSAGGAAKPSTVAVVMGLLTLYLVWGSTYLAMNWAVRDYPPFFVAMARALFAGGLLVAFSLARGAAKPTLRQWRSAAIVGGLLLVGGNGLATVVSQWLPSGLVALLLAMLPAWMAVLGPLYGKGDRVRPMVWAGIALGLLGVLLLVEGKPESLTRTGGHGPFALGIALAICSCFLWANGSLASRRLPQAPEPLLSAGMQLLAGGVLLAVVSAARGEWARVNPGMLSDVRATIAVVYLSLFGTLLGYSVYIWLLHRTAPALVATYAYVNPVVAVVLGVWLNGEIMTPRMVLAAGVIILAVVVIVTFGQRNGGRAKS
jgi:drug/metabolite transporter (DMT)-like permease